jgi:deoxyribose-phosphate aldolase
VKASGGIKTYSTAAYFLDLGCTRIGASTYLELLP